MKSRTFKEAFKYTLPVFTGYLFLGMAYGILMHNSGYSIWLTLFMSAVVLAGSMQYAAIPVFASPFSVLDTFLLTLMVNARHIFYGVTMLKPYRGTGAIKPYLIFAMTDETFSINASAKLSEDCNKRDFFFFVSFLDHFYWTAATLLGYLAGSAFNLDIKGISFVMTALFASIVAGQLENVRDRLPVITGIVCSVVCLILFSKNFIIPSMIAITVSLIAMKPKLDCNTTDEEDSVK